MNILVTGGAGFIGSHTCETLLRLGHSVAIIDELNDFYSPGLKRENLSIVRQVSPIHFYQCDICDEERMFQIFQAERPDAVIHLAGRAGVRPSLEQPLLYERVNVRGTFVLLEACRRSGVPRFLFASSSSVYGVAHQVPFREDDPVHRPISPYAATKFAGESICHTYSHLYGIQIACLRLFTVYGPRQRPDLAIRKFIQNIERNEPIPVFGDGSSGRDYTFVDDIVQGFLAALQLDRPYEVINLGNSNPVTLSELIGTIEHCLRKKATIQRLPPQPGDVPITYADITKAQALLGYSPATPFAQGIQKVVSWYLARQTAQAAC
jgi:UDP-glucuronate 4-epimerase